LPKDNPIKPAAEQRLRQGDIFIGLGQTSEAAACLVKAADFSSDNSRVFTLLAETRQINGKYLPALQIYDRIIELDATRAEVRITGNALSEISEHAQAVGAYENILKADDTNP